METDWKKKYEEALERARKYYGGDEGTLVCIEDMLEDVFPECAESEDERARSALLRGFNSMLANQPIGTFYGEPIKDIIAYLERQKERKPAIVKPHKGDGGNPYDMGVSEAQDYAINRGFGIPFNDGEVFVDERYITQTIGNILRWADEHPKEQKPADDKAFEDWIDGWWEEHKDKAYHEVTMDKKEFKNFCRGIRNMYQQKPDWSEEDEKIRQSIIKDIEFERNFTSATTGKVIGKYNEQINWLKSLSLNLKKRNEEAVKLCSNEWSEEDEEALDMCLDVIPKKWKTKSGILLTKWLKDNIHLQPKQEWSEEDMGFLYEVMTMVQSRGGWVRSDDAIENVKRWLNALPERFNLQPNQEWSEDDKAMIERLIRHTQKEFDELCNDRYGHQEIISDLKESCRERMNWLENRLKFLRPQPHIKESENNDTLRYCIEYINPLFPKIDDKLNVRHLRVPDEHGAEMALTIILSFGGKVYALYRGNVKDGKLGEWPTPMIVDTEDWYTEGWLQELEEQKKYNLKSLAIDFINYLDENRPEGKMGLSNSECEDIDKAFKENDWAKIMRYVEKYRPYWKPSEENINAIGRGN